MKIVFIDNYYPEFLRQIEREIIEEGDSSYLETRNKLLQYNFGTADYYSSNIKKLGWEAEDIIINSNLSQSRWAKENSPLLHLSNLIIQRTPKIRNYYNVIGNPLVLLKQIKQLKPDVVYIQCIGAIPTQITKQIKKYCRLLVGQIASKMPPESFFKPYDLVFSSLPNMVEQINQIGVNSKYLKIAFEETVLDKITKLNKKFDVTHLGGYGPIHQQRTQILEAVSNEINVDFWGYGLNNLSENSLIRKNYHGEAWGMDYYNILANSKITLTSHISSVAGDYANNMTLFEATGCGALLITDYKKNLGELFELDKEIVAFKTTEELIKKIHYYLEHEDERLKIALAGQKRTLKEHTYFHRMQEISQVFEDIL